MRICGAASDVTAKSVRSEAASVSSPSPISLQPLNDVTPAHAVTVLCDQQHRFAGETTASQRQGRGAASEHARPRRRIRLRRAVRRIVALLRSHQQQPVGGDARAEEQSWAGLHGALSRASGALRTSGLAQQSWAGARERRCGVEPRRAEGGHRPAASASRVSRVRLGAGVYRVARCAGGRAQRRALSEGGRGAGGAAGVAGTPAGGLARAAVAGVAFLDHPGGRQDCCSSCSSYPWPRPGVSASGNCTRCGERRPSCW